MLGNDSIIHHDVMFTLRPFFAHEFSTSHQNMLFLVLSTRTAPCALQTCFVSIKSDVQYEHQYTTVIFSVLRELDLAIVE